MVYLRYSDLMRNKLNKTTLIHEFWHAYSFCLGKERAREQILAPPTSVSLQKVMLGFPFPLASAEAEKNFAKLIALGKKRLRKHPTAPKSQKKGQRFKRYQQVLLECQPKHPTPLVIKKPEGKTEKKFIAIYNNIRSEIKTQGYSHIDNFLDNFYATKVLKNSGNDKLTLHGFPHKPFEKAKIILSQLRYAKKQISTRLLSNLPRNRAYHDLSHELDLPYKTLIKRIALMEENAEIMSLGQTFAATFFPEMLEYHRNMDAQYFPAEDSDQLEKYRAK